MGYRKKYPRLIFLLTFIVSLYAFLFINTPRVQAAPGGYCERDTDCGSYQSPNNYCCYAGGVGDGPRDWVCNDKWDSGRCDLGTNECVYIEGSRRWGHTDRCAYGCTDGYCNSPPAPTCDPRQGQECGTYGCCSPNNVESECYKQYTCSGSCEYAGYRNEGAYCGNGSCACNENSTNCPADCGSPPPTCPNNRCDNGETCTTCPQDCGTCPPSAKYKCSGASCIRDDVNGTYTTPNCDNACSSPPPTPRVPPCDPNQLNMSASPNPVALGSTIRFSLSGTQGSTWVRDTFSSGVSCPGFPASWPTNQTCTTTAGGSFTWTHYWKNCAPGNCGITGPECSKPLTYTITNPPPPTPAISPPSCIFPGYNGSGVTISWATATPPVTYVDISRFSNFSAYYHKAVTPPARSTTAPAGFNGYVGVSGSLTLNPGTTYWVRTYNGTRNSATTSFSIPLCVPAPPALLPPSCSTPVGDRATVSWSPSTGATLYALRVDNLADPWDGSCRSPKGDFCSNETLTSKTFPSTPGATYAWWVHACNNAGCSAAANGANFTCALPECPGGLGNCGSGPPPPRPETIGSCNGTWEYNPGPGPSLPYNIWCATNANPTRGYCYRCDPNITPWIQAVGDVHSNEGINAPGGP